MISEAGRDQFSRARELRRVVFAATTSLPDEQRRLLIELLDGMGVGAGVEARRCSCEADQRRAEQAACWRNVAGVYVKLLATLP